MKKLLIIFLIGVTSCNNKDSTCVFRTKSLGDISEVTYYDAEFEKVTKVSTIPHKEIYIENLSCLYRVKDTIVGGKVILEKCE